MDVGLHCALRGGALAEILDLLALLARRSTSIAFSRSPAASVRAFLQSIIPAPVRSRRAFTSLALISTALIARAGLLCAGLLRRPAGSGLRGGLDGSRGRPRPAAASATGDRRSGLGRGGSRQPAAAASAPAGAGGRGRSRRGRRRRRARPPRAPEGAPAPEAGGLYRRLRPGAACDGGCSGRLRRRPLLGPSRCGQLLGFAPGAASSASRLARASASRRARSSASWRARPPRRGTRGALRDDLADCAGDERAGADRVVVAGNHEVDPVGVAVGVDEPDDRDAQTLGLFARRSPRF